MRILRHSMVIVILTSLNLDADDWARFRGPNGSGVAGDSESLPTTWSPEANLAWKTPLPGPGVSSPIICWWKGLCNVLFRLWAGPREPRTN